MTVVVAASISVSFYFVSNFFFSLSLALLTFDWLDLASGLVIVFVVVVVVVVVGVQRQKNQDNYDDYDQSINWSILFFKFDQYDFIFYQFQMMRNNNNKGSRLMMNLFLESSMHTAQKTRIKNKTSGSNSIRISIKIHQIFFSLENLSRDQQFRDFF